MLRRALRLCAGLAALGLAPMVAAEEPIAHEDPRDARTLLDLLAKQLSSELGGESLFDADRGGHVGYFEGAVQLLLERMSIACERLDFATAPPVEGAEDFLASLALTAAAGERVVIDTSQTGLATVNFRGRVTPTSLTLERRPVDPEHPDRLVFDATLEDVGPFAGLVPSSEHDGEWVDVSGQASRVTAVMVVVQAAGGARAPHLEQVIVWGAPSVDGPPAEITLHLPDERRVYRSRRIEMVFGANGQYRGIRGGADLVALTEPVAAAHPAAATD